MIVTKRLKLFGIPVFSYMTQVDGDTISNTSGDFGFGLPEEEDDYEDEEYDEEYNNSFGFGVAK